MQGYEELFRGKRITLLGLGLLGRGAGDAEFLARCGAQVLVTDKKTETELAESVARLKKYPNVSFHLGGHQVEDFTACDMVIKAAGVRLDSPEVAAARAARVPVYMSTALFAKYAMEAGATVVGVTGTRGKSTVTHMIFHSLARAGRRVHLGGNVRGVSTLALLPEVEKGDVCVLELDSWQLQGFGDLSISPQISIFTNLMPDHQNYYRNMEEYFADKANIFSSQKEGDVLITGKDIADKIGTNPFRTRRVLNGLVPPAIPADWKLQIIGAHNRDNAAFAAAALAVLGLSDQEIKNGVESFEPVEGRLQLVREIRGVKIYNDNNATTAEATTAALRALGGGIILIAGGTDKGPDLGDLITEMKKNSKKVLFLAGNGTERMRKEFPDAPVFDSLKRAVDEAIRSASKGDVILFSPGFASFGMFKNEYDRNDQFLALVRDLV